MSDIALILLIVFLEIIHYKERRELCSRIQSKDLKEYKSLEEKPKAKKKEEEEKPRYEFV